jgi:hypothetical protein
MQAAGIASAAGGGGGLLGGAGTALQVMSEFDKAFGPKGSFTQGDIGGIGKSLQSMYDAGVGMMGGAGKAPEPTTMSKFNMLPSEFSQLPPEVRQEMLRRVMGR